MKTGLAVLGCRRFDSVNTMAELNGWARRNYCFIDPRKPLPSDRSLVLPYVMTTDGHDVFAYVGRKGTLDVGISFVIRKPTRFLESFRRSTRRFDELLSRQVILSFLALFSGAKVRRNVGGSVDRQETDLQESDIKLVPTGKAVKSLDNLQVFPLYFLVFKSSGTVIMSESNGVAAFVPLPISSVRSDPGLLTRMPYVSRTVARLIAEGHLPVPVARGDSFEV